MSPHCVIKNQQIHKLPSNLYYIPNILLYTYNNIKYIVLLDGDLTVHLLTTYVFHHLKVTVTLLNVESWVCL
jgi:hypothetical protein